jgi:hypothetical protein
MGTISDKFDFSLFFSNIIIYCIIAVNRNIMSLLKEIFEAGEFIKAKATILFLIPFWYVSIYLFNYQFYHREDTIIIVTMCIVISIVSSFSLAACLIFLFNPKQVKNTYLNAMSASVIILCLWLSLLIFIVYSSGFLFNQFIFFYLFIIIYFFPILVAGLVILLFPKTIITMKIKE